MDTVTHALLPVIIYEVSRRKSEWGGKWGIVAIGVSGALPDLLNPHLSLAARISSWSHGLPFWAVFSVSLMVWALSSRGKMLRPRLALACSAAYLLHILCDAISGGVNFLYPIGIFNWGSYWVDPIYWIPLDIVCVLMCYYLFRLRPLLGKRNKNRG